ncbi:hypothetical protein HU200_059389 [Digitaria exilis]|uniref:Uncharacterized protein n=1 Tax=Digitaria exilis TaxID=1010633 RepID=A0A835DYF3_9POAL|nr:hypothetical protein HU200_059389 [Digitaria exilis]
MSKQRQGELRPNGKDRKTSAAAAVRPSSPPLPPPVVFLGRLHASLFSTVASGLLAWSFRSSPARSAAPPPPRPDMYVPFFSDLPFYRGLFDPCNTATCSEEGRCPKHGKDSKDKRRRKKKSASASSQAVDI